MNNQKTDVSFSLVHPQGSAFWKDGAFVCGTPGCDCRIPTIGLLKELFRSGQLSLDAVLWSVADRFPRMPKSLQRRIDVVQALKPYVQTPGDVEAYVRNLVAHRTHDQHFLPGCMVELASFAPDRFRETVTPDDWALFLEHYAGGLHGVKQLRALVEFNRDVLKPLLRREEYSCHQRFTTPLFQIRDERKSGKLREVEELVSLTPHRTARRTLTPEEQNSEYGCRFLYTVAEYTPIMSPEAAWGFLFEEDIACIDEMLEWKAEHAPTRLPLCALHVFQPERARELLERTWAKWRESLLEKREMTRRIFRKIIQVDALSGNWEDGYLSDLAAVNLIAPERAAEIAEAEDWVVLKEALEHFRMRREDVYLPHHISRLRQLEPAYSKFFV